MADIDKFQRVCQEVVLPRCGTVGYPVCVKTKLEMTQVKSVFLLKQKKWIKIGNSNVFRFNLLAPASSFLGNQRGPTPTPGGHLLCDFTVSCGEH